MPEEKKTKNFNFFYNIIISATKTMTKNILLQKNHVFLNKNTCFNVILNMFHIGT